LRYGTLAGQAPVLPSIGVVILASCNCSPFD
jgi:hypothetical protein